MESELERSERRDSFHSKSSVFRVKRGNSIQLEGGLMIVDGATHFVLCKNGTD